MHIGCFTTLWRVLVCGLGFEDGTYEYEGAYLGVHDRSELYGILESSPPCDGLYKQKNDCFRKINGVKFAELIYSPQTKKKLIFRQLMD